jgi:predicted dehydrogenase
MADVFDRKLAASVRSLSRFNDQFDVPQDRQFLGFDGYRHAMDCLKPGDVVLLTTPPAFRWPMFQYAIEKGLNVFMEKPVTVDGPTTRRMLKLGEEASAKNLKVGVGLMIRHDPGRRELKKRIDDGQIGDLILLRASRMGAGGGFAKPRPAQMPELLYQIRNFHAFLWASGGVFSDYNIHQIDECSWMKGAWPTKARALGGRHYRGDNVDQNFDLYAVEYTYPDGTKLLFEHRQMPGCDMEFASFAHGTKGSAVITTSSHVPGRCRTYSDQNMSQDHLAWSFPRSDERNPYDVEWADLIDAIRNNKPYNEVKRGCEASLVTSMGRMAAHTGQTITFDQILNSDHEFAPDVDKLTMDSPAPLQMTEDGHYPIPEPGVKRTREF